MLPSKGVFDFMVQAGLRQVQLVWIGLGSRAPGLDQGWDSRPGMLLLLLGCCLRIKQGRKSVYQEAA